MSFGLNISFGRICKKFSKKEELILEDPKYVGMFPIRTEMTTIPDDPTKKDNVGWTVFESQGEPGPITLEKMETKISSEKIDKYRGTWGIPYEEDPESGHCYTDIEVLEFLKGRKCDDFALSYISALRPSSIRITEGSCTCDSRPGRVTVFVKNNIIERIEQEVTILSCHPFKNGYQHRVYLETGKYAKMPEGAVVMINPKAVAKIKRL
jgi:hypothetical protein